MRCRSHPPTMPRSPSCTFSKTAGTRGSWKKNSDNAGVPPQTDCASSRNSSRRHYTARFGKLYQKILQFAAEAQPDLIITGARGRHALDLAVFVPLPIA